MLLVTTPSALKNGHMVIVFTKWLTLLNVHTMRERNAHGDRYFPKAFYVVSVASSYLWLL